MKIVIAYLYYDLLNLYGEKGNLKEIIKELKNQDINYEIKYLSINDNLKFENYDLVIMNAGTENNQKIAIKHLKKYKKDLKKAIEDNKFFLITGNAIDLFGRNLLKSKDKFLGIFKYDIVRTDLPFSSRLEIMEQISETLELGDFNPYREWKKEELKIQMVPQEPMKMIFLKKH